MMVRLAMRMAGIALVFLASCFLGNAVELRLKRRWMILREFCELLHYMEREMVFHRTPLEEALELAAGSGLGEIRDMLQSVAARLKKQEGLSFREIWGSEAERYLGDVISGEETKKEIAGMWTAFCNQDTVMQETMLKKQEIRFLTLCQDAERDYREKSGLYRRLGAAGGIFLIILLL